jgi:glycosyltransferase involved in cell wall biosynthesis
MYVINYIEEGKLGGPQIYVLRLSAALHGDVEIDIILPKDDSGLFIEQCKKNKLNCNTMPITKLTKNIYALVRYVYNFVFEINDAVRYFKKVDCDIVYVCGGSWQYKGVIAAKIAGVKLIWHLNDTSMPFFIRFIFRLLSNLADGYIFASERSKSYYKPYLNTLKPGFVIPAPVDVSMFNPENSYNLEPSSDSDIDLINSLRGKTIIGMVANISPVKGFEMFVHVVNEVNKIVDNVVFIVIGEIYSSQQSYYNKICDLYNDLAIDNIKFIGSRGDVRVLLKEFHIYICTSRFESSPIAVWEALAMKKPVISTDVGDVSLYVRNNYNGFIIDDNNILSMADKIKCLVLDNNKRITFGERSREIAVQNLDVEKCATMHMKAFSTILGKQTVQKVGP